MFTKNRLITVAVALVAVAAANRIEQGRRLLGTEGGGWF